MSRSAPLRYLTTGCEAGRPARVPHVNAFYQWPLLGRWFTLW